MNDTVITEIPASFSVYSKKLEWLGSLNQRQDRDYSCRTIFNKVTGGLSDEWWFRDPNIKMLFVLKWGYE